MSESGCKIENINGDGESRRRDAHDEYMTDITTNQ